jgi:hypothetical protein
VKGGEGSGAGARSCGAGLKLKIQSTHRRKEYLKRVWFVINFHEIETPRIGFFPGPLFFLLPMEILRKVFYREPAVPDHPESTHEVADHVF